MLVLGASKTTSFILTMPDGQEIELRLTGDYEGSPRISFNAPQSVNIRREKITRRRN